MHTGNFAALGLNDPAVLLQWSRRGHDGSPGGERSLGCDCGCCELAGLPWWNHTAPLLQQNVQPRCPGGRIRHCWYLLSLQGFRINKNDCGLEDHSNCNQGNKRAQVKFSDAHGTAHDCCVCKRDTLLCLHDVISKKRRYVRQIEKA